MFSMDNQGQSIKSAWVLDGMIRQHPRVIDKLARVSVFYSQALAIGDSVRPSVLDDLSP